MSSMTTELITSAAAGTQDVFATLDQLAASLAGKKGYVLEIQGHTDTSGTGAINKRLSDQRARTVYEYLAVQHDIPLFRLTLLGYGDKGAIADNSTAEGRAQNRRVDVRILVSSVSDLRVRN